MELLLSFLTAIYKNSSTTMFLFLSRYLKPPCVRRETFNSPDRRTCLSSHSIAKLCSSFVILFRSSAASTHVFFYSHLHVFSSSWSSSKFTSSNEKKSCTVFSSSHIFCAVVVSRMMWWFWFPLVAGLSSWHAGVLFISDLNFLTTSHSVSVYYTVIS